MTDTYFDSFRALQDKLLERMNQRGDMPGFSRSVQSIVNVLSDLGEDERDDLKLIQVVIADSSLTQKVLRLANSAMYVVFEGQITTVSRAVAILGIQTVAHLALGLKVIESFSGVDSTLVSVKGEMEKSMLSGVIGRQFASCTASVRDAEEAAVCSVLHGLGRMLVAFYLPESWAIIERTSVGTLDNTACVRVLSVTFEAVGQFIATRWGLPVKLVSALRTPPAVTDGHALSHEDWLCTIGSAATQSAHILHENPEGNPTAMQEVIDKYCSQLGIEPQQMQEALLRAKAVIAETLGSSPVAERSEIQTRDRKLCLGLEELRLAVKTSSLSQTVSLAVEFLHLSLGSSRSYYFLKSAKEHCYKARLALGAGAEELKVGLTFDDRFKPDVFHAAMASDKCFYVENTKSVSVKHRLPMWWLASLSSAQSFCIVPMNSIRTPLGFIYLDWGPKTSQKLEGYPLEVLTEVRTIISQSIERSRVTNALACQAVPA